MQYMQVQQLRELRLERDRQFSKEAERLHQLKQVKLAKVRFGTYPISTFIRSILWQNKLLWLRVHTIRNPPASA